MLLDLSLWRTFLDTDPWLSWSKAEQSFSFRPHYSKQNMVGNILSVTACLLKNEPTSPGI
jgi:activator of HSP90 ATPase